MVMITIAIGARVTAAQSSAPASGHWEGTIQVPGQSLAVVVDLAEQNGSWVGTIAIPAQGIKGFALSPLTVDGTSVTFGMKGIPGDPVFKGTVSGDPRSLSGQFSQGTASIPFVLHLEGRAENRSDANEHGHHERPRRLVGRRAQRTGPDASPGDRPQERGRRRRRNGDEPRSGRHENPDRAGVTEGHGDHPARQRDWRQLRRDARQRGNERNLVAGWGDAASGTQTRTEVIRRFEPALADRDRDRPSLLLRHGELLEEWFGLFE